jgi:hypothetical protein
MQFRCLSCSLISWALVKPPFDEDATAHPRHDTITDAFSKSNAEAASPAVSVLEGGLGHVEQKGGSPLRWDSAILQGFNCKLYTLFYIEF